MALYFGQIPVPGGNYAKKISGSSLKNKHPVVTIVNIVKNAIV